MMKDVKTRIVNAAFACCIFSLLCASFAVRGDEVAGDAESLNTFGLYKINRATTNTMIAIPWTWYSPTQIAVTNIPVKKLVKTENLDSGDMLYAPIGNDAYAAWTVVSNETMLAGGKVETNLEWSAVQVVRVDGDGFGRMVFHKDDDEDENYYSQSMRIARGQGLWLYRHRPLDASGNIRPFWVLGQSVTGDVSTVVQAPTGTLTVCSTMIGNPYPQDVVINSLSFTGTISTQDRIKIHTAAGINRDLIYVSGKGWRELTTVVVGGKKRNLYVYDTVVPAGMSFWYDRRGAGDLTISWPKPSAE